MPIEQLFIAAQAGGEQQQCESLELVAEQGIIGDRNFGLSKWPGQNITFIESEEISAYNHYFNQSLAPSDCRRNIITRDIRLNNLVGKHFRIGSVNFFGIELCEPCSDLGERLKNHNISKQSVVKAFTHKGGLRADIISSGTVECGMNITIIKSGTLD